MKAESESRRVWFRKVSIMLVHACRFKTEMNRVNAADDIMINQYISDWTLMT